MTQYPVIHGRNFSARADETGRMVWLALTSADDREFDYYDDDGRVLECLEALEAAGGDCRDAEESVAAALRETRLWFLHQFAGQRYDSPDAILASERLEWDCVWPEINRDGELTGGFTEAGEGYLLVNDEAAISVEEAIAGGWTIDGDETYATEPTK